MEKGYSEADYAMGDRIKAAMHSRKITVPMMAKDLHYSQVTILRIRRRGVRSVDALRAMADYLGVSADWLMCRDKAWDNPSEK